MQTIKHPVQIPAMLLIVALSLLATTGCAVIGGIFKAGAWVGAIAVILVIALIGGAITMMSRRE